MLFRRTLPPIFRSFLRQRGHFALLALLLGVLSLSGISTWAEESQLSKTCKEQLLAHTPRPKTIEDKILNLMLPLLSEAAKITADVQPAQNTSELKSQLQKLINNPRLMKMYRSANQKLDKMAPRAQLYGPFEVQNFSEVIPGVFRSANPKLEQLMNLHQAGIIDVVIPLNSELSNIANMDTGTTLPISHERRELIIKSLLATGLSPEYAQANFEFYESRFSYAQAAKNGSVPFMQYRGLDYLADSVEGFLGVLKEIQAFRSEGKKVLFHCSIGKHRTGMTAVLLKVLDKKGEISEDEMKDLAVEYIKFNWNDQPITRAQHFILLPLIMQSQPFRELMGEI